MAALKGAAAWVAFGLSMALSAFISYREAARLGDTPDIAMGSKVNTRSTQEPLKIVYGQVRIGGNDVYMGTDGASNEDLWIVQTLSEGQCDEIYQINNVDQVFLNNKIYTTLGGNVAYYFHGGTATQAVDTNLNSALSEWTDCLKHTCYIVWKLSFDTDYFQGLPKREIILKGKRLYDFRDSTTAYSNNPVLAIYDYMTDTRYGMSIDSSDIDTTSWTSAANYCDTKGWTLNMVVNQNQPAQQVVDTMLLHFRGHIVWYDGQFYMRYSDTAYESSIMTLTDSHIVQDASGKAMISISQPSRWKRPDTIRVKFVDTDMDYTTDDIMLGDNAGVVNELRLPGCTNRQQAADLGVYHLERMQLDRVVTGTFRDDALKLEPHDLITFTSSALSITAQTMRVMSTKIQPDGLVSLALMYEQDSLYNDDYDVDTVNVYNCSLPDLADEPPSITNGAVTEEVYSYRLRNFTRLAISFNAPSNYPWVKHYEVWLSYDNSTWEYLFHANGDFYIDPVEEGTNYYIRIKTVSIWGTKQRDANDYRLTHLVTGYGDAPDSIGALYALHNQNTINLWADRVSDDDVESYEFRVGASWNAAVFLAALRSPNMSLSGVKPGEHTFHCNTLSNNGLYGTLPQSATVTLQDPPDGYNQAENRRWTVQKTETDDYEGDRLSLVINDANHYHITIGTLTYKASLKIKDSHHIMNSDKLTLT
jgi:hypothetical protein